MLKIKQRKERAFHNLNLDSKEDAFAFVKAFLYNKSLLIKFVPEFGKAKINEFLDDGSIMIVTHPDFRPEDKFCVYGLLDRYIEIDLLIKEIRGPGYYRCNIEKVKRASSARKEIRFRVSPEKVTATNFKISKHTIDISDFSIPTTIKVLLDQFQSQNSSLGDIVKVDIIGTEDPVLRHIKKTGETLFIPDASNPASYKAITPDFIDVRKVMGEDFDKYFIKNIEKGYKSIIISPVIYLDESQNCIPFAYIQVISKSINFSLENVLELKDLIFKLIDRIRNANTVLLQINQEIVDISKTGAKLKITDENLKKYIHKSGGFVFDIVFKLQAPITIYGEIKSTYMDMHDTGNMYVSVDFAGNSSRQNEMKRFYSMIDPMIKAYKNKILTDMKTGKK